jgi:integrase
MTARAVQNCLGLIESRPVGMGNTDCSAKPATASERAPDGMKIAQPRGGEPIRVVMTKAGVPRYRVTLDGDPYPDGRRRQIRSTHDTLTKAREHVTAHRADRGRGVLVPPDRQSFEDYAKTAWLPRKQRSPKVREKTALNYEVALRHPISAFGSKALAKVTRADVERMIYALADANRAQSTATLALFIVRSVFEDAIEDGLVAKNPAKKVQPVGRQARQRSALTVQQIRTLRSHLSADRLFGCWLLTLCGLRRSEVMGLRWSDLDLNAGTLTISRGRVLVDGKRTVEGKPKTERGTRELPLPADLLSALRKMLESQAIAFGVDHVGASHIAVDDTGGPLRPERWTDLWREHCKAAGVPAVTLHAARHSSVTAMRDAGVADHVVAAWHGHDEYIMRKVYSHAQAEGLAAAGTALERVLSGDAKVSV